MSTVRWIIRFARHSPAAGLYQLGRWVGFHGFNRITDCVPERGCILDMGCGHGLLAVMLAAGSSARQVVGVDAIEARLNAGRRVAESAGLANVRFERRDFTNMPDERFDAIIFSDSLFYYPLQRQEKILDQARTRLTAGGALIVKEQGSRPAWKASMVRLQERVVVGLKTGVGRSREWRRIGTQGFHLWDMDRLSEVLSARGMIVTSESIDAWSYLSHYLVVARNEARLA